MLEIESSVYGTWHEPTMMSYKHAIQRAGTAEYLHKKDPDAGEVKVWIVHPDGTREQYTRELEARISELDSSDEG